MTVEAAAPTVPSSTLAIPKSPNLTCPAFDRKMFCVLRSRCKIFRLCT